MTDAFTEIYICYGSEVPVGRFIEKMTIYDEKLTLEFKSGLKIDVEA